MLTTDVNAVWLWWFILFVLGMGFLPLSMTIFSRFFDRGYIFSKLLGIAISSYVVYLLGIFHIVPFGQVSSFIILFLLIGLCYYFAPRKWRLKYLFKTGWKIFLAEEILFVLALFFWSYVHSFAPDIHGLEKYMDFGFINSILRSTYFPPKDMWFTPYYINYYYYGHYITAFLTKLSGIPSYITFNLMMATIFTFCLTQTFSLGSTLYVYLRKSQRVRVVKVFMAGLLTAALTTFAGNLHILYGFFGTYDPEKPVPFWQLPFKPWTFPNAYWYPNATRYIYHTIHEFPIYSWTVADLHGHVLDIPFVLFVVAVLLSMFLSVDPEEDEGLDDGEKRDSRLQHLWKKYPFFSKLEKFSQYFDVHIGYIILLGFLVSIMYMTNAWDGAIYLLLSALVFFSIGWQKHQEQQSKYSHAEPTVTVIANAKESKKVKNKSEAKWIRPFLEKLIISVVTVVAFFVMFSLPYNANFKPFVSGIGVLCAPKFLTDKGKIGPFLFEADHCQHSYWWELMVLYGFFYFFAITFLVFLIRSKKVFRSDLFVLLLILLSTMLIAIPEFIYVKDIYPAHYRANTMFKLVFQAFMLLSISSGYIIVRLLAPADKDSGFLRKVVFPYFFFFPITLFLGTLVFTYPYLAINSYYGNFRNYQGLNGITYLKKLYPDDFAAIEWLNANVTGQPVILEAQGDSYTDYARVSANTGLPTVLGWTVHEWLWRGTYSVPAPRITEVQTMYQTKDLAVLKPLLQKYAVKYVFVGNMEYQKYPTLDEQKFAQVGKIVFQSGNTKIYEIIK
jgi:YYY domain-containing protein